jgi:tight adherence protein C
VSPAAFVAVAGWFGIVVRVLRWRRRSPIRSRLPRSRDARSNMPNATQTPAQLSNDVDRTWDRLLSGVGQTLRTTVDWLQRRRARTFGSPTQIALPIDDRTLGLAVVTSLGVNLVVAAIDLRLVPVLTILVGLVVWSGSKASQRKRNTSKREAVERASPLLLDLLRAGIASGLAPRDVFTTLQLRERVDELATFTDAFARLNQALGSGVGFVDALETLRGEGPTLNGLVAAIQASEHYGVALAPSLDSLAVDARLMRRRSIETKARRLPVVLLFPLVVCVLPAFVLLTIVPLLFSGLSSISW